MNVAELVHIPIDRCYICPDCHCVISSAVLCPCGNPYQLQSLGMILNRRKEERK